ncbi:MAG: DUF6376 family protein [Bacilli bacterium]|jgi:TolA-binding protein|nr:DUF6376 family protein [Bacilli bacterium]
MNKKKLSIVFVLFLLVGCSNPLMKPIDNARLYAGEYAKKVNESIQLASDDKEYEASITTLQDKITSLKKVELSKELESIKDKIVSKGEAINEEIIKAHQAFKDKNVNAYNESMTKLNKLVDEYNNLVDEINSKE